MIIHSENRQQQIQEKTEQYFMDRIDQDADWIMNVFSNNLDHYAKEVLYSFDQIFKQCIRRQAAVSKESIGFVAIYFLRSSYLLGTYELQIDLYHENYLFDRNPVTCNYVPSFIAQLVEKDWMEYIGYMKKNMIQVQYHELYPYRKIIADKFMKLLQTYFTTLAPLLLNLKSFHQMKRNPDVVFTYGEYRCKGIELNKELKEG